WTSSTNAPRARSASTRSRCTCSWRRAGPNMPKPCWRDCASTATGLLRRPESGAVGLGVDDLDGQGLAVGGDVLDGLALLVAVDRLAQRRLRREDLQVVVVALHLAGAEQELLGVAVADEAVGDHHALLDDTVVGRRLADPGVLEQLGELGDPPVELAELLT